MFTHTTGFWCWTISSHSCLMKNSWAYLTFMALLPHYSSFTTLLLLPSLWVGLNLKCWSTATAFQFKPTATTLNQYRNGQGRWKIFKRNHSRWSQTLTARNRDGKGHKWTKQTEGKRESIGEGLIAQRQTERRDLPLSFQRERKQTASAERMTESQAQLGKKCRGSKFITNHRYDVFE